jgi:hypothetical protein
LLWDAHADVPTFIDARQALRPPAPSGGRALHELLSGQPAPSEPEADRKARAAHDRETVSQYIERYRASGLELFERGVAERRIVDTLRPMFKQPNSPYDLSQMVDVIATLEERIR